MCGTLLKSVAIGSGAGTNQFGVFFVVDLIDEQGVHRTITSDDELIWRMPDSSNFCVEFIPINGSDVYRSKPVAFAEK